VTLREQIAEDVSSVHINTDEFAETLVYRPDGGTPRTVAGVVDEEGDFPDLQTGRNSVEIIDVFVSRDSTTGIDAPRFGDAISRTSDGTGVDAKWYSYSGQKMDVDEFAWTLRFTRAVPSKHGGLPSR